MIFQGLSGSDLARGRMSFLALAKPGTKYDQKFQHRCFITLKLESLKTVQQLQETLEIPESKLPVKNLGNQSTEELMYFLQMPIPSHYNMLIRIDPSWRVICFSGKLLSSAAPERRFSESWVARVQCRKGGRTFSTPVGMESLRTSPSYCHLTQTVLLSHLILEPLLGLWKLGSLKRKHLGNKRTSHRLEENISTKCIS